MDELNKKDLSEMVLRLAHGIRNPLATIKTGVQLVKHISDPDDEVKEYLDSALESVERIDLIIKDVQRYVKIGPTAPERIAVPEIIEDILLSMEPQFEAKGMKLNLEKGDACAIFTDRIQMTLAIKELIWNAIQHSPEKSNITVRWYKNEHRQVMIYIEDECGGIRPEMQDKVMRPFFSTSRLGTGLGLNIVAKFLEISGGNLEMCPQHNNGCQFTIILPEA